MYKDVCAHLGELLGSMQTNPIRSTCDENRLPLAFEKPAQHLSHRDTSWRVTPYKSDRMRMGSSTISRMTWPGKWFTHHHIDTHGKEASHCPMCVRAVPDILKGTSCVRARADELEKLKEAAQISRGGLLQIL